MVNLFVLPTSHCAAFTGRWNCFLSSFCAHAGTHRQLVFTLRSAQNEVIFRHYALFTSLPRLELIHSCFCRALCFCQKWVLRVRHTTIDNRIACVIGSRRTKRRARACLSTCERTTYLFLHFFVTSFLHVAFDLNFVSSRILNWHRPSQTTSFFQSRFHS